MTTDLSKVPETDYQNITDLLKQAGMKSQAKLLVDPVIALGHQYSEVTDYMHVVAPDSRMWSLEDFKEAGVDFTSSEGIVWLKQVAKAKHSGRFSNGISIYCQRSEVNHFELFAVGNVTDANQKFRQFLIALLGVSSEEIRLRIDQFDAKVLTDKAHQAQVDQEMAYRAARKVQVIYRIANWTDSKRHRLDLLWASIISTAPFVLASWWYGFLVIAFYMAYWVITGIVDRIAHHYGGLTNNHAHWGYIHPIPKVPDKPTSLMSKRELKRVAAASA